MDKEIKIHVNGESFELQSDKITVGDLIKLGEGKPGEYELQKRDGEKGAVVATYDNPKESIVVKDDDYFTTRYTGSINVA